MRVGLVGYGKGGRFFHAREAARDALGMAGVETLPGQTIVTLKKWSLEIGLHGDSTNAPSLA